MHAVANPVATLSLLVPTTLLPQEGEEFENGLLTQRVTSAADLFKVFQRLAAPKAAKFLLSAEDITFDGDVNEESALQLLHLSTDPDDGLPQLQSWPAMSYFDWAGVIREVGHAMLSEHFLGTPEELARVFTEAVREVASIAGLGFQGEAVPLLTVKLGPETAEICFLGIWLANESAMAQLRNNLPGATWQDGAALGQNTCLLLDAAEVEGRGLREAVLSAAMLAMVFGSATSAQAADAMPKAPRTTSRLASFFGFDSHRGEKLPVKSQKLVQDAPRIYRDILSRPHSDLRVVIVIGEQRAYLVKDGEVAFETPISSGRGPRMTPRGTFTITEKVRSGKYSTIYKCPLQGWMRIGEMPIGMHEGELPGYPASHGCVRMPIESAHFIFDNAPRGTTVQIVDSWTRPLQGAAGTQLVAQN